MQGIPRTPADRVETVTLDSEDLDQQQDHPVLDPVLPRAFNEIRDEDCFFLDGSTDDVAHELATSKVEAAPSSNRTMLRITREQFSALFD